MSQIGQQKINQALLAEIRQWQAEQLISSEQAEQLVARYPVLAESIASSRLITIVINLGAVLVGLGALLFVAANWQLISVPLKLTLIFLSILVSHLLGWRLKFEPGNHPKLGTAFLLLGSMFYGSGIWLVSQIFNINTELSQGLFLWGFGTAASAFVTGSVPVGMLATIVTGAWAISCTTQIEAFLLSLAVSLCLAFRHRSPWICSIALIFGAFWIASNSIVHELALCLYGTLLFSGYLWLQIKGKLMQKPFMLIGVTSTLLSLLSATFDTDSTIINNGQHHLSLFLAVGLCSLNLIIAGAVTRLERKLKPEALGTVLAALATSALHLVNIESARIVLSNLLLIITMIALIWTGTKRLHSVSLVNLTIIFCALDILVRYFDIFFSMIDRSLFFVAGGIVLMITGAIAERSRRKLIGGLQ